MGQQASSVPLPASLGGDLPLSAGGELITKQPKPRGEHAQQGKSRQSGQPRLRGSKTG